MAFNWDAFLRRYSEELLQDDWVKELSDPEVVESGWLGYRGATQGQIEALERHLGTSLPASYRSFLETSNGWRIVDPFIYRLWSTEEVEWFAVRNQQWIDIYNSPTPYGEPLDAPDDKYFRYGRDQDTIDFRARYLQSALEISDLGDSAIMLLNPEIRDPAGEWEAWFFANWHPGAVRYRSFQQMMEARREHVIGSRNGSR